MAIAFVKSAKGSSALATTTASFASATTAGNLIVLAFASDDYNGTPDAGWTQSAGMEQQTFHGGYVWWRISTGETNFSYTIGSATNSAWVIAEFSGTDATPYDISAGQFQQTSTDNYTTPSITPSTGNRLLVAMLGGSVNTDLSAQSWGSWLNSFTAIDSIGSAGSGTNDLTGIAYRLVTGDGATGYSSGATSTGVTFQTKSGLIIAFKEAAGPARIQQNAGSVDGNANIVTSLPGSTTSGNTILIFANSAGTIDTPFGFVSRSPQVNAQGFYLFEKLIASGNSSDTPTLTMSGAYNATWHISEYSGISGYDVSSGNSSVGIANATVPTPTITPTSGARIIVAAMAVTASVSSGTFAAGDPQGWGNSFSGRNSTSQSGSVGSGRDSIVSGWADRFGVVGDGSTAYSTSASFTASSGVGSPATIISAYRVSSGVGATSTLSPGLFSNQNAFFAATVLRGGRSIVPGLVSDSDTFFAPSVKASRLISPGLLSDSDSFYSPTMSIGALQLAASLFSNVNSFYAPTVGRSSLSLAPPLLANTSTFPTQKIFNLGEIEGYTISGAGYLVKTSDGSLWTYVYDENGNPLRDEETDQFYIRPADLTVTPDLFTNIATYYSPSIQTVTLLISPSLVASANTFYGAQLARYSPVNPSLFVDTDTFYGASVTTGRVFVSPSLLPSTNTFYGSVAATGQILLAPGLFGSLNNFFGAAITTSRAISAPLYVDADQFYPPLTSNLSRLSPPVPFGADAFYAASISVGPVVLSAGLFGSEAVIYNPFIGTGGAFVQPAYLDNDNSFFTPTISIGPVSVSPSLYTNDITFYVPVVSSSIAIASSFVANDQIFYPSTVNVGAASIVPDIFVDVDAFYELTSGRGIRPDILDDVDEFYSPGVVAGQVVLTADIFDDDDVFYGGSVGFVYESSGVFANENVFYDAEWSGLNRVAPQLLQGANIKRPLMQFSIIPEIADGKSSVSMQYRRRSVSSKYDRNRTSVTWYQH